MPALSPWLLQVAGFCCRAGGELPAGGEGAEAGLAVAPGRQGSEGGRLVQTSLHFSFTDDP